MQRCLNGSNEFNFKDDSFTNCMANEQEKMWKKYNWKQIVEKMSPKIIPKIVQKPSLKSSQISTQQSPRNPPQNCENKCKFYPLKMCVYNYKYKRQCMLECRKYGVVSQMKTTALLPICIKSNGM